MKKVLSIALALCMLLAVMVVPLNVSASEAPATFTTTDQLFHTDSNTGLDAYAGTPTVDGTIDTDNVWDKAISLPVHNGAGSVYLLWDADALYMLSVEENSSWSARVAKTYEEIIETTGPNLWSNGYNGTMLTVLPVSEYVQGVTKNFQITSYLYKSKDGTDVVTGTAYEGVVRVRECTYTTNAKDYTLSKAYQSNDATKESETGMKSAFTKTSENGFIIETKIPWSYLGISATDVVAGATPLGVKIYQTYSAGTHVGNLTGSSNGDAAGFDPITLVAEKPAGSSSIPRITPDTAYWATALASEATEFEISTAEQLLGLSWYMEGNSTGTATLGKTFKLMNDIDLNPGADWAALKSGTVLQVNAPRNIWMSLDEFYGTFDGQGHTITGFYGSGNANGGQTPDWGLFGGRQADGGVKNLVIGAGYISDNDGGGFGSLFGVVYNRQAGDVTVDVENVYFTKDFTMVVNKNGEGASGSQSGAILAGYYSNVAGDTFTVTMKNVVFAGSMIVTDANESAVGSFYGVWRTGAQGGTNVKTTFSTTLIDCLSTGDISAKATAEWAGKAETDIRTGDKVTSIPEANEGAWVETEMGIMPVALVDMVGASVYKQATAVNEGTYSVRILEEVASLNYASVGFNWTLTKGDGTKLAGTTKDNTKVYSSVIANGETKTAADMNENFMKGENNQIVALTLNNLDANDTYTLTVTPVWTLTNGTEVVSAVSHTTTLAPYVAPAN